MTEATMDTSGITTALFAVVWSVIHFNLIGLDDIPFLTPPSGR